ncbi:Mu transposase C-terminal domain-containing protein [Advenella sp. RU8]|uniref:Mu transposase C-terminal domain-containing protein n=1 Tax=Advenella sp. RU8 TaxID=3399575 RepID=UPI003AAA9405
MLFKNDIFLCNGSQMRLLHINEAGIAWVINLDDKLAWPEKWYHSQIQDYKLITPSTTTPFNPSDASLRKCEKLWERLQKLLDRYGFSLFDPSSRKACLQEHAKEYKCSINSLYKDLRRYWQRGQTKLALLPDYHLSGRPKPVGKEVEGEEKQIYATVGRGRKPKQQRTIFQVSEQDCHHFHQVIKKEYLTNQQISVVDAYASVVNRYYRFVDGNGEFHVCPLGERPSLRQFRRFLYEHYNIEDRQRKREGDSDYELLHRKKLGTIMADCLGVGHYYEIDATIADIYLVSSTDPTKIIGKPTLYYIIDRKSRLISGFYFGLENASWNGALQAILSIAEDKQALCARYGVKYDPQDWPAHQVFPMEFLADRGDMISHASTNIVEGLQVAVTNLPGRRPDWKPVVEAGFRQAHNAIRPIAPAYDPPSNATRRRGKHYEKDACLTVKDFGHLMLNVIIAHNRRVMGSYPLDIKELNDGVSPSPISLWNHGIVSRAGVLSRFAEHTVRFALLRKKKAYVTAQGIEFDGCYYSCSQAIAEKWFERARVKRFAVTVSYDPRLVDSVYIHPLDGKSEPIVATLTDRSRKYAGFSFEEVAYYESLQAEVRYQAEHSGLENSIHLKNTTQPIINKAKAKLKNQNLKVSRTARRADIKPVREEERKQERQHMAKIDGGKNEFEKRQQDTFDPGGNHLKVAQGNQRSNNSAPSMSDMVKAAKERMNNQ